MPNVIFTDNSMQIINSMDEKIIAVLEEGAGEIVAQTKKNSRIDTGETANSFRYEVVDSEQTAYIGSDKENALWEELGTGEYALKGNGRKGGWKYQDAKGDWHFTYGKRPSRAFWKAYNSKKADIKQNIENSMKGM